MFLGAFKSSLHIIEFNWAAADERVGGEPGEERGEGRAGHHAGGSRCSALSAGPEELCLGRERPRSSALRPTAGHPAPGAHLPRERQPTAGVQQALYCRRLVKRRAATQSLCNPPAHGHLLVLGRKTERC